MSSRLPRFKLYWVATDDHDGDWFVMARTAREARRFHEVQEGYFPGEAFATRVKTLGDEGRKGWPTHEELVEHGLTIVRADQPRLVEYRGVRYSEGRLDYEIAVNSATYDIARRLYGLPHIDEMILSGMRHAE